MMQIFMSFMGTIGYTIRGNGAEELIGAAYSGKAWPKANMVPKTWKWQDTCFRLEDSIAEVTLLDYQLTTKE